MRQIVLPTEPVPPFKGPKPYQARAMNAFDEGVANGMRSLVYNLPTGTGKTLTGLLTAMKYGRTLWIAHRDELLTQPHSDLVWKGIWPDADVGYVCGSDDRMHAKNFVFASIQTLQSPRRLARYNMGRAYFRFIVYDECHHAVSPGARRTLEHFRSPICVPEGMPPPILCGLSATLDRTDGIGLNTVFDAIAFSMSLEDAIADGHLVPYISERFVVQIDTSKVSRDANGEANQHELDAAQEKAQPAQATAEAVRDKTGDRRGVVFTLSVAQAEETSARLNAMGISARWICGETPDEERWRILSDFAACKFRVLCNAMILTEGWDDKDIEFVCVARLTGSRSLYQQMAGRGLRLPSPGSRKRDCLLLDMVDAYGTLGLASAASLEGKPPKTGLATLDEWESENKPEDDDTSPEETGDERSASTDDAELARVRAFMRAATSGTPSVVFSVRKVAWVDIAEGVHALPMGPNGDVVMLRAPDGLWTAEVWYGVGFGKKPLVTVPMPVEVVQTICEDHARSAGALSQKDAAWRRVAAGASTVSQLRSAGLLSRSTITQGEAADLAFAAKLRAHYEPRPPLEGPKT